MDDRAKADFIGILCHIYLLYNAFDTIGGEVRSDKISIMWLVIFVRASSSVVDSQYFGVI